MASITVDQTETIQNEVHRVIGQQLNHLDVVIEFVKQNVKQNIDGLSMGFDDQTMNLLISFVAYTEIEKLASDALKQLYIKPNHIS